MRITHHPSKHLLLTPATKSYRICECYCCQTVCILTEPLSHSEGRRSCDLSQAVDGSANTFKLYPFIFLHFKACSDYWRQSITGASPVFHTVAPSPGFHLPHRFIKMLCIGFITARTFKPAAAAHLHHSGVTF